ncbi:hypothetical protein BDQ17DRAFT_1327739 [Cyathus striatus]|nr:hypothetical protein BDQ17DRAFT_1327739 [Cyathus striatus]
MDVDHVDTLHRHMQLIATFITLYDHACNIDEEVKYVWKTPWTISRILFIATRYVGDFYGICIISFYIFPWATMLLIVLCQANLCYRICALYKNRKFLIYTICSLFTLEIFGWAGSLINDKANFVRKLIVMDSIAYYGLSFVLYLMMGMLWFINQQCNHFRYTSNAVVLNNLRTYIH